MSGVEEVRFEEALKQLEAIVSRLEIGDLPLEEALSVFEEGVRLTKLCSQRLNDAERRVNILVRSADPNSGGLEERPFPALNGVEGPVLSPVEGEEEAGEES
ncbi:MAG: exodeoxyribonuclease VII small subunit [Candidatus Methylomirabilis sp.]